MRLCIDRLIRSGVCCLGFAIVCLLSRLPLSAQDHWAQFRGPDAKGISNNESLPLEWSNEKNVAWSVEVEGRGWSSPVVWGDYVFLTTVDSEGEVESDIQGLYFGGERSEPSTDTHHWKVVCLELESGDLVWETEVHQGPPQTSIHIKNSYASETPVTDGEVVICYFGNVGVYALDYRGEVIWSREMEPVPTRFNWGLAASPALYEDQVFIVNDNEEQSYLLCLDKATGETVWQMDREENSNWSTPFVWSYEGRTEVVTPGTDQTRSYSLEGELLWSLSGMSVITIATPYVYNDQLIISSGYILDPNRPIYAIKQNANGDISLGEEEDANEWIAWCNRQSAPYNPSTLAYRDSVFVLLDRAMYAVYDANTGEQTHDRRRIPNSRAFTASPWAYRNHVFVIDEDGQTTVFDADNQFEVVGRNELGDGDLCLATPAMVGDRLLIRTAKRLYCIRESDR